MPAKNLRARKTRNVEGATRERGLVRIGGAHATGADRTQLGSIVEDLRDLSDRLKALGVPGGRVQVFFPARDPGEDQPVRLENYVDLEDLANLLHYVADMMEE